MIDGVERSLSSVVLTGCLIISLSASSVSAADRWAFTVNDPVNNLSHDFWDPFISQAKVAGLPTQFLVAMDPEFISLEFDDLHAFAAEYHPENHQLILNRSLSFNAAGGRLKPVPGLAPRELGTLYHELFHAYMDYISSLANPESAGPAAARLLAFARDRQQCQYQQVSITPIVQRRSRTEVRFLTDHESWEALNETWAVFVGWLIYTKMELKKSVRSHAAVESAWVNRLKKADQDGDLIGYYEPENDAERSMARKRYLASSHKITPKEVSRLLQDVFEYSPLEAHRISGVMQPNRVSSPGNPVCHEPVE